MFLDKKKREMQAHDVSRTFASPERPTPPNCPSREVTGIGELAGSKVRTDEVVVRASKQPQLSFVGVLVAWPFLVLGV